VVSARENAPNPIRHAAPDVELAEAQLALGRPELVEDATDGEPSEPSALELEPDDAGGELVAVPDAHPERRPHAGRRLVNFVRGSWRELQRVQWPDRRQVMQATGVVIGFVLVAGLFLGVADFLAGKLMDYILK
jgi:preprotein translocase SecE subunit